MTAQRMPLPAVGMMAAHLLMELIKEKNLLQRDLDRQLYGMTGKNGKPGTYLDQISHDAAKYAWALAEKVEELQPEQRNG